MMYKNISEVRAAYNYTGEIEYISKKNGERFILADTHDKPMIDCQIYICNKQGNIIGNIDYKIEKYDNVAKLYLVFVNETYRRLGIGRSALEYFEKIIRKNRTCKIEAELQPYKGITLKELIEFYEDNNYQVNLKNKQITKTLPKIIS